MEAKRPTGRPLALAVVAITVTAAVIAGVAPVATAGTDATTVERDAGDTDSPIVVVDPQPTDPDGDGRFEDVNGDGSTSVTDVQALFANLDVEAVQSNATRFDFNGDGRVSVSDVQALFVEVTTDDPAEPTAEDRAWRGTFGGPRQDQFREVVPTPDGGIALAGQSRRRSAPDDDYQQRGWLVVTDSNGEEVVNRTYAPFDWRGHRAVDVATVNGSAGAATGDGYLLAGHSFRYAPYSWKGWLVRLDEDGDRVWRTNLTAPGDHLFVAEMVQSDEGTLVLGAAFETDQNQSRAWLLDGDGDVRWNWTFDPTPGYSVGDLAVTPEGAVVAYGNGRLAAIGPGGTTRWTHDVSDVTPYPGAVAPAPDGDGVVVVAGNMSSAVAVDSSGERRWTQTYDVPPPDEPYPSHRQPRFELVDAFPDGDGLLLTGAVDLPAWGYRRPTTVRVGPDGAEWRVGAHGSPVALVRDTARTADGGVTFAGQTRWYDGAADRRLPVSADGQTAPADWDGDGAAEDVTGEGETTTADVRALAARLGLEGVSGLEGTSPTFPEPGTVADERAQELAPTFDFTGDGRVDVRDVRRLYESLGVQYEAVAVDTSGDSSDPPVVEGGLGGGSVEAGPYLTVVTNRTGLDRIDRSQLGQPGKRLLEETAFDSSYLVVYQTYHGTGRPDYTVREASLANGTLSVTITDGPALGPSQDFLQTLFVRVSLLDRARPDRVDVYEYAYAYRDRGGTVTNRTATTAVPAGE